MQALQHSRSQFKPESVQTIDVPDDRLNLYSILEQEAELGVQALTRGSADMAVTFFQSALQKMTVDQPLYDHLVHDLLLSYKLLIQQLLQNHDPSTAVDFVNASLRLEISGRMNEDAGFLRRFAGVFQNLAVILFQSGLYEASLVCCRKAISVYASPGAYVNFTNALAATGGRAQLS